MSIYLILIKYIYLCQEKVFDIASILATYNSPYVSKIKNEK